jgi:hypothetical protein
MQEFSTAGKQGSHIAKGQKKAGQKQIDINNQQATNAGTNATDLYSSLTPFYSGEMTNPQGLGTAGMNAATTASQQALGGATAGVTGVGALQTARTRNTAGITESLDASSRNAMQTGSQNAQNLQVQNELLKEQQRQAGAQGTGQLYGANLGQQTSLLGQQAGNLQGRAAGGSWMQNTFAPFAAGMSSLVPKV